MSTYLAGKRPYDVAWSRDGHRIYVSDWASKSILVYALPSEGPPVDDKPQATIPVGEHPNQIAVHPKDDRVFVACASSNCVSVIDTRRGFVIETICTSLFPRAPEGSTPDALAVAPDGKTLYVANADNNCVAVIDIADAEPEPGQGVHPHRLVSDGGRRHARRQDAARRRRQGEPDQAQPDPEASRAEPKATDPREAADLPFPYIGTTLSGALSIVPSRRRRSSPRTPRRSTRTAPTPTSS